MRRATLALALSLLLVVSSTLPASADRWYTSAPVLGIIDAGRDADAARKAGATWDRALFLWQLIQPNNAHDWLLDNYVKQSKLDTTLSTGFPVVGVVQGTPGWADTDYHDGAAGVPTGLDYPVDDPRNTFGGQVHAETGARLPPGPHQHVGHLERRPGLLPTANPARGGPGRAVRRTFTN